MRYKVLTIILFLLAFSLPAQIKKAALSQKQADAILKSGLQVSDSVLYHIAKAQLQFSDLGANVQVFSDVSFIVVTWSPVKGAKGYNVYRKQGSSGYQKINKQLITWPTDASKTDKLFDKLLPSSSCSWERDHIRSAAMAEFYPQFIDTSRAKVFRFLGKSYYQVLLIIGEAYADSSITQGKSYTYRIKYLDSKKKEHDHGNVATVIAGQLPTVSKPTGLKASSGDSKILLLWNDPPSTELVAGYNVYRMASLKTGYERINKRPVYATIAVDLNGNELNPSRYGFLDTTAVNYTTYAYKVVPRGPLGKAGTESDMVTAMSKDLTLPAMPANLEILAEKSNALALTWNYVTRDVRGRKEAAKLYRIYRYNDYNTAVADTGKGTTHMLATVIEQTTLKSPPGKHYAFLAGDTTRTYTDNKVVPEKVYWYRISCVDTAGNIGHKTYAHSAILPDYEPPDPPTLIQAYGFEKYILITWAKPDMNNPINQDLTGYMVYRGICGGDYVKKNREWVYAPYPLHLLADITHKDTLSYKDTSVPDGSPICYRYALKAYDKAQNLSSMSDSVCERRQDKTPPDPPVITALQARNDAIKLTCVSAPIQDMKGFIVERRQESEKTFKVVYADSVPEKVACDDIPVSADSVIASKVNRLEFTDKNVAAEKVYWYQVRAFDYNGNQSKPSPRISTFTYEMMSMAKPMDLQAAYLRYRVELAWVPDANHYSKSLRGFVVFRSFGKDGVYRQISGFISQNEFIDKNVQLGMHYWYKVQAFDRNGDRSALSDAVGIVTK